MADQGISQRYKVLPLNFIAHSLRINYLSPLFAHIENIDVMYPLMLSPETIVILIYRKRALRPIFYNSLFYLAIILFILIFLGKLKTYNKYPSPDTQA